MSSKGVSYKVKKGANAGPRIPTASEDHNQIFTVPFRGGRLPRFTLAVQVSEAVREGIYHFCITVLHLASLFLLLSTSPTFSTNVSTPTTLLKNLPVTTSSLSSPRQHRRHVLHNVRLRKVQPLL